MEAITIGLRLDDELLEDADQTCERYPEIEDVESPIPASPSFNSTLSPTDFENSLDETVSGGPTSVAIARALDLNDSWGQSFISEVPASGEDLLPPRGGSAFTTAGLGLCEALDTTPTTHQSWHDECHYEPLLQMADDVTPTHSNAAFGMGKHGTAGSNGKAINNNKKTKPLTFATQNTCGFSNLTLQNLLELDLDVIAATEMHGNHESLRSYRFIPGGVVPKSDKAIGTGFENIMSEWAAE